MHDRPLHLVIALFSLAVVLPGGVAGEQIDGKVIDISRKTARIAVDRAASVAVGDRVEVYYLLPEIEVEAHVGNGQVSSVTPGIVVATIEDASGDVSPGQNSRIESRAAPAKGIDTPGAKSANQSGEVWFRAYRGRVTPDMARTKSAAGIWSAAGWRVFRKPSGESGLATGGHCDQGRR